MRRFIRSEIGAAAIWVFLSLFTAALITPWLYQGGKALAASASQHDFPAWIEWFAAACGRSKIGRYFDRALLLSALVLLPFLFRRIRRLRVASPRVDGSADKAGLREIIVQIATGCFIAGGILWGLGWILHAAGAYAPKGDAVSVVKLFSKIIVPAVAASLLEEWLFRGVLLGLWLRFSKPAAAILGTSLLFAFLHFLHPPDGTVLADPSHPLAGFDLLGKILLHFTDPLFFVTDFATLLAVGLILAWARVKTGALWFSIGLHAGWVMAFKAYNLFYDDVSSHPLRPWGVGDSLRSGILPLAALALTAVICHFVLKRFAAPRPSPASR